MQRTTKSVIVSAAVPKTNDNDNHLQTITIKTHLAHAIKVPLGLLLTAVNLTEACLCAMALAQSLRLYDPCTSIDTTETLSSLCHFCTAEKLVCDEARAVIKCFVSMKSK